MLAPHICEQHSTTRYPKVPPFIHHIFFSATAPEGFGIEINARPNALLCSAFDNN